jgi:hypothetical protein
MLGGMTVEPSAEEVPNAPDVGAAGDELPPPHPARMAVISTVICHVMGLLMLLNLFIVILLKYYPKWNNVIERLLARTYLGVLSKHPLLTLL